jgi:hypothetical protein
MCRACGCRKPVRTAHLRFCRSNRCGALDLRNCAIHANRPVAAALDSSLEGLHPALSDRTVFALFAGLAGRSYWLRSARSGRTAGTATAPITLRETPAQQTRPGALTCSFTGTRVRRDGSPELRGPRE